MFLQAETQCAVYTPHWTPQRWNYSESNPDVISKEVCCYQTQPAGGSGDAENKQS